MGRWLQVEVRPTVWSLCMWERKNNRVPGHLRTYQKSTASGVRGMTFPLADMIFILCRWSPRRHRLYNRFRRIRTAAQMSQKYLLLVSLRGHIFLRNHALSIFLHGHFLSVPRTAISIYKLTLSFFGW